MTKNAPDDRDELEQTATNPPTPEDNPLSKAPNPVETVTQADDTRSDSDRLQWLRPDDSDSDGDGRTGVLSTYVEVHALVLGLSVGAMAAQSGDFSTVAAIVGAGAAGSRAQVGLPEKYVDQAKSELPYFIFGAGLGFLGVKYGLSGAGLGAW